MEKSILRYVWKHSRRQQIWMLIVIAASMPMYFLSLDLPKRIVNGPIQGEGFERPGETQAFLAFDLPFGETLFGEPINLFGGFELERFNMLMALCLAFLGMVFVNGFFKLYINTYKGRMGERILRRLRYELFDRVLRYPVQKVRQVKPAEISSIIKDEVEPLGEFIGDAFTLPLFMGSQAITGLTFLFLQNYFFGFLTLGIVLFQAWLIPLLRRRLLELGRMRQRAARKLAGSIGETVQGMDDVHLHDTTNLARARASGMLGKIYMIRFELYQRKFAVKFINNFLIQFLAFLFYAVGGYFVINGQMDIGALVASIAAYKDLPGPIKSLINWDQLRLMNQVRYGQVIEDFASSPVEPAERHMMAEQDVPPIAEGFIADRLTVRDASGSAILEGIETELQRGETVALVGDTRSGVNRFMEVLVRLLPRTHGRVTLDNKDLDDLPEYVTGRRIGYADGTTFFASGTVYETVCEPLMNQPPSHAPKKPKDPDKQFQMQESKWAGNFVAEVSSEWIDRKRIGIESDESFAEHIKNVMITAGLYDDLLQFGLRRQLSEDEADETRTLLVEARERFAERLKDSGLNSLVELLDPEKYSEQLTIGENIIFGTTKNENYDPFSLEKNGVVREILRETGTEEQLYDVGIKIAETNVELFGDLEDDSPLFDQPGAVSPEKIAELKILLESLASRESRRSNDKYRDQVLGLTFDYIERESRFGLVDENLQKQILVVREELAKKLRDTGSDAVQFYDPDNYNASLSILDNVLFGRIDGRRAGAQDRVITAITELLYEMDLTGPIFRAGLEFDIGIGGRNLSDPQAQKLKLARALIKKPDILILNRALSALDSDNRLAVYDELIKLSGDPDKRTMGILCIPVDAGLAKKFDRVLRFDRGSVVYDGPPGEMDADLEEIEHDSEGKD